MARHSSAQLSRHLDTHGSGGCQPVSGNGAYSITEAPLGTARRLRIVGIGAGASGLNMIRTLRQTLEESTYEHVVYEKNHEIGGTWLENKYPGCRCDVPSHNYQFSWRKNPSWSSFFAPAAEIEEYLCQLCDDEGMRPYIKTSHRIIGASWSEAKALWELRIQNLQDGTIFGDYANFLIDAAGILNAWAWPDIDGLRDFKGSLIHSASWPDNFDLAGKTVALIGNGASGVQLLPAIQPHVKKVHHIIRTPAAIIPPRIMTMRMGPAAPLLNQIEIDEKERFTDAQIEKFKSDPELYEKFIAALESDSSGRFAIALLKDSPQQKWAAGKVKEFMEAMLGGDPRLCNALIPKFPLGCRRFTPAAGYLEAFRDPKVVLHTDGIKRFVAQGIEFGNGEVIEVDSIICATGFNSSFCPAYPLVGRNGDLQDIWAEQTPKSYMSLAVAGLPNYFKFLGPNAPSAHGDVFTLSEHIATYIANLIQKCQVEGIKSIVPSEAAVDDYFEHVTSFMPRTAWAGGCRSWYKNGKADAPVTGLHPGSRMHFIQMLQKFRGEDWEYTYDNARQNRFGYLGNGFAAEEYKMLVGGLATK